MQVDLWPAVTFLLALITGIIVPVSTLLINKFKKLDRHFAILNDAIERVQLRSDAGEQEQNRHWLNYYRNEIMKFMERIRVHPERVPTKEHYQAVFEHYKQYQKLGGNHYVDLVMEQIEELYKQHYEAGAYVSDKEKQNNSLEPY